MLRERDEDDGEANKRSKWDLTTPDFATPAAGPPVAPVAATLASFPTLIDGPALDATGRFLEFEAADVSFKLQLHHDVIAALLGLDGAVITAIRERTGCRVHLSDFTSGPKMELNFGGTVEASHSAVGLVLAEMQNSCSTNSNVCQV